MPAEEEGVQLFSFSRASYFVPGSRQQWEDHAIEFLASGNARMNDGTPLKTWVNVHNEIQLAHTQGVPVSEAGRLAILSMGDAKKAIMQATSSANLAAERAAAEWANTRHSARAKQLALSPPATPTIRRGSDAFKA